MHVFMLYMYVHMSIVLSPMCAPLGITRVLVTRQQRARAFVRHRAYTHNYYAMAQLAGTHSRAREHTFITRREKKTNKRVKSNVRDVRVVLPPATQNHTAADAHQRDWCARVSESMAYACKFGRPAAARGACGRHVSCLASVHCVGAFVRTLYDVVSEKSTDARQTRSWHRVRCARVAPSPTYFHIYIHTQNIYTIRLLVCIFHMCRRAYCDNDKATNNRAATRSKLVSFFPTMPNIYDLISIYTCDGLCLFAHKTRCPLCSISMLPCAVANWSRLHQIRGICGCNYNRVRCGFKPIIMYSHRCRHVGTLLLHINYAAAQLEYKVINILLVNNRVLAGRNHKQLAGPVPRERDETIRTRCVCVCRIMSHTMLATPKTHA